MELKALFCFYPLNVKYNHGIALLSALCKQKGIQTELFMLDSLDDFRVRLQDWPSDSVNFSVVTSKDYELSVPFMELARKQGKIVMLGGTWTGLGHPICESVTRVCRGEGERLPHFILQGDDLLFRESMVWADLNSLPLPDYELFKGIPFDRGIPETNGKFCLPYYSSRGCPYPCRFCQIRYQPKFRVRTKVEEDLTEVVARCHPEVLFIGDAQLPYFVPAWRESWGNFRHPFVAYIRADIKPDDLLWLIDRGLIGCAFGVESGDEKYRNEVLKKGLSDGDLWRTVDSLKRSGVWYVPFFMTHTPEESFSQRTKTVQMAERIGGRPFIWKYEELSSWQ